MEAGAGSLYGCPDSRSRSRSPFVRDLEAVERHYSQHGYHMDYSGRFFKMPREDQESHFGKRQPFCACHTCNVQRQPEYASANKIFGGCPEVSTDSGHWSGAVQEQWCSQSRGYMGKGCEGLSSGMQSPCSFSIHTPLRGDNDPFYNVSERDSLSSPPSVSRMCVGGKCSPQSSRLGGSSLDLLRQYGPRYPPAANQIILHKWFLIRVQQEDASMSMHVAVGGFVRYGIQDSEFVKTGPIVDRMDKFKLRTRDGVDVRLMGCMNEQATVANGFSVWIAQLFLTGFPVTWKRALEDDSVVSKMKRRVNSLNNDQCEAVTEAIPGAGRTIPGSLQEIVTKSSSPATSSRDTKGLGETGVAPQVAAESPSRAVDAPSKESPNTEGQNDVKAADSSGGVEGQCGNLSLGTPEQVVIDSRKRSTKRAPSRYSKRLRKEDAVTHGQESDGSNEGPKKNSNPLIGVIVAETIDRSDGNQDFDVNAANLLGGHVELDGDQCPEIIIQQQDDGLADRRKQSRSRAPTSRARRRKERRQKSKVVKSKLVSPEEVREVTVAEEQPETGACQEQVEISLPSVPLEQLETSDDQLDSNLSKEQVPAAQSKRISHRTKRSALPPPLPAPRVTKSEVIQAYGLKTSRSGRLLVPPLAYWRNQTLAHDKDGGIIAIFDGFQERPSDTGYFNFKPPREKKALKLQEKLCAAAAEAPVLKQSSRDKGKKNVKGTV